MPLIDLRQCRSNITSQGGENGIVTAILGAIGLRSRFAVEFGGFDATDLSNIHPLWVNEGFTGVLIEGDRAVHAKIARQIEQITARGAKGRCTALHRWVRPQGPDSLDAILSGLGPPFGPVPADIDVMSIDIDSTDYLVWKGLEKFRPRVVLIEYNCTIPPPYEIAGVEGGIPVGCSASALVSLGQQKGYTLVAVTEFNCVFVQNADAHHFAEAGNLLAHFDWSWPVYMMRSFDGGQFCSRRVRSHYSMTPGEIEQFAGGKGFARPPSDLVGWLRHPKRRVTRLMRRLFGK